MAHPYGTDNEDRPALQIKDEHVIACLRCLAMDAVQKANSGHPGTPMAMAPVGYTLWARTLSYDPEDPNWPNRDRFVLSMGHACMLQYGLLHLAGVKKESGDPAVSLDDIKNFRQFGSSCPGHPEFGETVGVEVTTGPLGQGVATSVGMAIASKWLAANFNRPGFDLFDYDVYALAGDGCLQEGVSFEAACIAGHLKLGNLCWIWDNNGITISGSTALSTSEDIPARFGACGWNVRTVEDANDVKALESAFSLIKQEQDRPTLLVVQSRIAWGAPNKQGSHHAHGTPLGDEEVSAAKSFYNWPNEKFLVPDEVCRHFRRQLARGTEKHKDWKKLLDSYKTKYPDEGKRLELLLGGQLPKGWDEHFEAFPTDPKGMATRQSSSVCLNMVGEGVPWLIGGSADLANSCGTVLQGMGNLMPPTLESGNYAGRNLHFGIREHAMGSIVNGLALSRLRPFCSTFLAFSDYMKPPLRLSSMMRIPCTFVFTHDSIGVGEDGPTHQPVEHLDALRALPGMVVFRPCDANECLEMWKHIMKENRLAPVAAILSRQSLPTLDREKFASASGLHKGGYILTCSSNGGAPDVILMSTGSEVHLMLEAHDALSADGIEVWSLSMPSIELFKSQPAKYIESVLPSGCRARVSIEASKGDCWGSLIGLDGEHVGMNGFGASGPMERIQMEKGLTVKAVENAARRVMKEQVNTKLHSNSKKRERTFDSEEASAHRRSFQQGSAIVFQPKAFCLPAADFAGTRAADFALL
ncbi:tkt [Symbiodinium sp. CCMP2592]|nr:tkt [Symbiodinium sp. CCMP2592]